MGTVKGILYVGMDPNLLVGVGPNAGIPGTVTATAKSGVAHSFHVSSDGKFTLRLPPGTYTLTGVSPRFHDGAEICETPEPSFHLVTVKAGQSAFAGVVCTVDPLPSSQN